MREGGTEGKQLQKTIRQGKCPSDEDKQEKGQNLPLEETDGFAMVTTVRSRVGGGLGGTRVKGLHHEKQ